MLIPFFLVAGDGDIQVHYIKKITSAAAGEQVTVEFSIANNSSRPLILVGHLDLPGCWLPLPANDILFHLSPNQSIVQKMTLQIHQDAKPKEYTIAYQVWDLYERSKMDRDIMRVVVLPQSSVCEEIMSPPECSETDPALQNQKESPPPTQWELSDFNLETAVESEKKVEDSGSKDCAFFTDSTAVSRFNQKTHVTVNVESSQIVQPEELLFFSGLVTNDDDKSLQDLLILTTPAGWQVIPQQEIEINVASKESSVYFFSVKVPKNARAGRYELLLRMKNSPQTISPIVLEIPGNKEFKIEARDLAPCYPLNQPVDLDVTLCNLGNIPLNVRLQIGGDPCCELRYPSVLAIDPQDELTVKLVVDPDLGIDDPKQFILVKIFDEATGEMLCQNTFSLNFSMYSGFGEEEDPYIRIPSHFTMLAFGDNGDVAVAGEWAGRGVIDPEKERAIDYVFRLPSKKCNTIYQVDQRLYVNITDPQWDIVLGDAIYALTPLTQRQRYGRGAGIDYAGERFSAGTHYIQTNCCRSGEDPKDTAAYIGYAPTEDLVCTVNYLHREFDNDQPSADILSLTGEYQINDRIHADIEFADNLKSQPDDLGTKAFRFNLEGQVGESTSFGVERMKVAPAFYGYYNNLSLTSGVLDFPLSKKIRININGTALKQDFTNSYDLDTLASIDLKQRQCSARVTYQIDDVNSIACHTQWLRAEDLGLLNHYDFNQHWIGITITERLWGWNLLMTTSLGKQEDYKTRWTVHNLKKYYFSFNKQLTKSFYASLFYDTGHTNYYDAKSWNISGGVSLSYRPRAHSYGELLLQQSQDPEGQYKMKQVTARWYHAFANHHSVEFLTQYFHYKVHYPSNFLFLITYKIPFGFPLAKRKDIGNICGRVVDVYHGQPVANTLVTVGERQCRTDDEGNFTFRSVKTGTHEVKTQFLPQDYTKQEIYNEEVAVRGAADNQVTIAILPACTISGQVVQMVANENDINDQQKILLEGIRLIAERNDGEEGYVTLSKANGSFQFLNLRPGHWKVWIEKEELPKLYRFEEDEVSFNLIPNQKKELTFKMTPIKREMKKIN